MVSLGGLVLLVVGCLFSLLFLSLPPLVGAQEEVIKVGILHSLTGTISISEKTLVDVVQMMIAELNEAGGLLGKRVEGIVVDPESNWPLFATKANQLLTDDGVSVVFGCWTSVSRKSVLPVFEELNGLLFYPVQYEGEECSMNVFYTGAAPNQQAIPAVEYLIDQLNKKQFVLLGTDYVYPRTTNKILRGYLLQRGINEGDILEIYTPFGHADFIGIIQQIQDFATNNEAAIISTINGDANTYFYQELVRKGISADDIPSIAFSVGEGELKDIFNKNPLVGHLAAWNYFMSVDTPQNEKFILKWQNYTKDPTRVTNDPIEAHYIGFKMWVQAVKQAGTTNVDAVRQAMYGQRVTSLSGFDVIMGSNHHLHKPVMIGKITLEGQFNIIHQGNTTIPAQPWSPYIPANANFTADWSYPWVCSRCNTPQGFKDISPDSLFA